METQVDLYAKVREYAAWLESNVEKISRVAEESRDNLGLFDVLRAQAGFYIQSRDKLYELFPQLTSTEKDEMATLRTVLDQAERKYLVNVLKLTGGSKPQAAAILGISRKNLWEKLKSHRLESESE